MPEGVIMFDRAYFDSPEWLNQKNEAGGFGKGAAWLDLLALANQKATVMAVRGIEIPLERGQCGWSKQALALRWGWSQGTVRAVFVGWEKRQRIRVESSNETTITTILNFDDWQVALLGMANEQTAGNLRPRCDQTDEQTATDRERDREYRRIGEGGGMGKPAPTLQPVLIPTDDEVRLCCDSYPGNLALGIPAKIPEVWWLGWLAHQLLDEKKFPRDWQRVLKLKFESDFKARHPKALANLPKANGATSTGTHAQPRETWQIEKELTALRAQIATHARTSWPANREMPKKIAAEFDALVQRRKELEQQLKTA